MAKLTRRTLGVMIVATLSLVAGFSNSVQACCLSWLCCGFGGGYYSSYIPYYGGYAPSYFGCSSCGGMGGYAPVVWDGCASCVGGGCAVSSPSGNSLRPQPDAGTQQPPRDEFRPGRGTDTPSNESRPSRSRTFEESPLDGTGRRSAPRNEGSIDSRGEGRRDSAPATETEPIDQFDEPVRSRRERSRTDTKKEPVPIEDLPPTENNDSFPVDEPASGEIKTDRPNLGAPSTTDDGLSKGSIIPSRGPAPLPLLEELDNRPADATELKLDDKNSTSAVSPKGRLVLQGRFETPRYVRLKLRPNPQWIAVPAARLARN